jgi:Family of unknown function (DUF6174)
MKKLVAIAGILALATALLVWVGPWRTGDRGLGDAKASWAQAAIRDYTWTIDTGCFGACTNGRELTIVVRNGRPIRMVPSMKDMQLLAGTPLTVDRLFARIDDLSDSGSYSVDYDHAYGYPTRGSFDPIENAVDDEWRFTVRSFVAGR